MGANDTTPVPLAGVGSVAPTLSVYIDVLDTVTSTGSSAVDPTASAVECSTDTVVASASQPEDPTTLVVECLTDTVSATLGVPDDPQTYAVDCPTDTVAVNAVAYGPTVPADGACAVVVGQLQGALGNLTSSVVAGATAVADNGEATFGINSLTNALLDAIALNAAASKQAIDALTKASSDADLASAQAIDALNAASSATFAASRQALDALTAANATATSASDYAIATARSALAGVLQTVATATSSYASNTASVNIAIGALSNSTLSVAAEFVTLNAAFGGNAASLTQSLVTLVDATVSTSTFVTDLTSAFGAGQAETKDALTATSNATSSTASSLLELNTSFGSSAASVQEQFTAQSTATQSVAGVTTLFTASFANSSAAYSQQIASYANAQVATTTVVTNLSAVQGANNANLSEALTVTVNATGSNASQLTKLNTSFDTASASTSQQFLAQSTATQAVSGSITTFTAVFGGNSTGYSQEIAQLATANVSTSTAVTTFTSTFAGQTATLTQMAVTTANATSDTASQLTTLNTSFDTASASTSQQFTAQSTATQAVAGSLTYFNAALGSQSSGYAQQIATFANAQNTTSTAVTTLTSTYGGNTAALAQSLTTNASATATTVTLTQDLAASFGSNAASTLTALVAQSTATQSVSGALSEFQAQVGGSISSVNTTVGALSTAQQTTAQSLTQLTSSFAAGGGSGNLIANSDFIDGTYDGWGFAQNVSTATSSGINLAGYSPVSGVPGVLYANANAVPPSGQVLQYAAGQNSSTRTPVVSNQIYEISIYAAIHRMQTVQIYAVLFDVNGVGYQNSYLGSGGRRYTGTAAPGKDAAQLGDIGNFDQIGGLFTVPSGCSYVAILAQGVTDGEGAPYLFLSRPQIRLATPNQTGLSPYVSGTQVNVPAIQSTITQNAQTAAAANSTTAQNLTQLASTYNTYVTNTAGALGSLQGQIDSANSTITQNAQTAASANATTATNLSALTSSFAAGVGGGNLLANSDFNGLDNYAYGGDPGAGAQHGVVALPNNQGRYYSYLPANAGYSDLATPTVYISPNTPYEFSVAAENDFGGGCQLFLGWFDINSNIISYVQVGGINYSNIIGANGFPTYRMGGFATSPINAVAAYVIMRHVATGFNSYVNYAQPMLRAASPNQTVLSPYQPGTQANVSALNSAITNVAMTAASANATTATNLSTLQSTYNTYVTNTAGALGSLQGQIDSANSTITQNAQTAASANSTTAQNLTQLASTYNTFAGNTNATLGSLQGQIDSANSTITQNAQTAASANSTTANLVTTLQSTFATGGGSGNLLPNSDFVGGGYDGWTFNPSAGSATNGINLSGYVSSQGTPGVLWAQYSGTPAANQTLAWVSAGAYLKVPVTTGQVYECSIYAAYHRMSTVQIYAVLCDANGNAYQDSYLGSGGTSLAANSSAGVAGALSNYSQIGGFLTIPSGCSYICLLVQGITDGESNPYVFLTRPQIRLATPNQTTLSPYVAGAQVNVASITQQATTTANSVGQLQAQYVLALTLNGSTGGFNVVGAQRADGTGAIFTTTFNSNVVINGSLIVNGTLTQGTLTQQAQGNLTSAHNATVLTSPGSGTYTVPAGVYWLYVEVWGGGGGGGSPATTTQTSSNEGGSEIVAAPAYSGAGGGYAFTALQVTPGQQIAYVVGAGGAGGAPSGSGGYAGDGTPSSFGPLSATGGRGGDYQGGYNVSTPPPPPPPGGTGSGGLDFQGGSGLVFGGGPIVGGHGYSIPATIPAQASCGGANGYYAGGQYASGGAGGPGLIKILF